MPWSSSRPTTASSSGEHGLYSHDNSLYIQLLRVPLLVWFPSRVPEGLSVDDYVSLRDVPATVLDLVGLTGETRFPGTSLARYWDPAERCLSPGQEILLSEVRKGIRTPPSEPGSRGDMASLVIDGVHYIKNGDGVEELYALAEDPEEEHDLARSPEAQSWLPALQGHARHHAT